MLPQSRQRILEELAPDALVLDIGGWAKPFPRADWVLDLAPYATRGLYGTDGTGDERFTEATWIQRDICDHEPYPFDDDHFDFVVCSHTLEDVRDPIRVCTEMARVAKAGYIEVPSRLEEQSYGFHGPWTGWSHHRWLIDNVDGDLEFVFKHAVVHAQGNDRFPDGFQQQLSPEERVTRLWWTGGFEARERIFMEPAELTAYLGDFVRQGVESRPVDTRSLPWRLSRALRPSSREP